jgi:excinuclease UvrABC nuclease subunit
MSQVYMAHVRIDIDFEKIPYEGGIYILFEKGQISYIGQSSCLRNRVRVQAYDIIIGKFDRVVFGVNSNKKERLEIEGELIKRYQPFLNVQHNLSAALANKVRRERHDSFYRSAAARQKEHAEKIAAIFKKHS